MVRMYLKPRKNDKLDRFIKFAKQNGATYVEDEDDGFIAIYQIPKKCGTSKIALAHLFHDNTFQIGTINSDCDNFEMVTSSDTFYPEEGMWIIKTLMKILKYDP